MKIEHTIIVCAVLTGLFVFGYSDNKTDQQAEKNVYLRQIKLLEENNTILKKQVAMLEKQISDLSDKQAYQMRLDLKRTRRQDELIASKKVEILAEKELHLKKKPIQKKEEILIAARAKAWADRIAEKRKIDALKRKGEVENIRKDVGICADIIDASGNKFQVANLLRYKYFYGNKRSKGAKFKITRGGAEISLPFEKVSHAELTLPSSKSNKEVIATIFLRNDNVLDNCRIDGYQELSGRYMTTGEKIGFKLHRIKSIRFYTDNEYRELKPTENAIIKIKPLKHNKSEYKRTPIIDTLLDCSLRQIGADPNSDEARKAKKIAKNTFNPFAPANQLQKDIDNYVKTVFEEK